jgi:adenylate cyclase, class 2
MIEVELKYQLNPALSAQLQEQLQQMSFRDAVDNHDMYYDTPAFDLLQHAVFVRVRNKRELQFKYNEAADKAHTQSIERSFTLEPDSASLTSMNALFAHFLPRWLPASSFAQAIGLNNLIELASIRNKRKIYTQDNMIVSVDEVEELGSFLEVEAQYEEGKDTTSPLATLQAFAARFKLQPVRIGYVELWLRSHNPQAYLLGKYQQ